MRIRLFDRSELLRTRDRAHTTTTATMSTLTLHLSRTIPKGLQPCASRKLASSTTTTKALKPISRRTATLVPLGAGFVIISAITVIEDSNLLKFSVGESQEATTEDSDLAASLAADF